MHEVSPEPVSHLSQHILLPMLLRCTTTPDATGEVRFGHAVDALKTAEDGMVHLTVRNEQVWSTDDA